jgi:hypothetical protein
MLKATRVRNFLHVEMGGKAKIARPSAFLQTHSFSTYSLGLIKESVLVLDETYFSEQTSPCRSNMGTRDVRT